MDGDPNDGNPRPPSDRRLDAVGLLCPEPVFRARAALAALQAGQVIEIVTDDPLAGVDLQVFCERTGHEWLDSVERDGVRRTRIRKRRDAEASD